MTTLIQVLAGFGALALLVCLVKGIKRTMEWKEYLDNETSSNKFWREHNNTKNYELERRIIKLEVANTIKSTGLGV